MRSAMLLVVTLLLASSSQAAPVKPDTHTATKHIVSRSSVAEMLLQLATKDAIIADLRRQLAAKDAEVIRTKDEMRNLAMRTYPVQMSQPPLPEVILGIPSNLDDQNPGRYIIVSFNVGGDGKPKDAKLEQFSGNDAVDQLALNAALKLYLPPSPNDPAERHLRFMFKVQRQ